MYASSLSCQADMDRLAHLVHGDSGAPPIKKATGFQLLKAGLVPRPMSQSYHPECRSDAQPWGRQACGAEV